MRVKCIIHIRPGQDGVVFGYFLGRLECEAREKRGEEDFHLNDGELGARAGVRAKRESHQIGDTRMGGRTSGESPREEKIEA